MIHPWLLSPSQISRHCSFPHFDMLESCVTIAGGAARHSKNFPESQKTPMPPPAWKASKDFRT
jgi:hypothetical protein